MSDSDLRRAVCSQVAKVLCETRQSRKLSMTQLSGRAGLSRAMISFVERELRNPTLDTLLRICSVLEVDLAEVIRMATAQARRSLRK